MGTLIPALQSLLDEQLDLSPSADVNNRIRQLTTTIAQWNKVIQRVEDLHASADRGEISSSSATLTHVTGFDSSKITSSLVCDNNSSILSWQSNFLVGGFFFFFVVVVFFSFFTHVETMLSTLNRVYSLRLHDNVKTM